MYIESIYGFYHGQDPRTFDPDIESCRPGEIAAHKAAIEKASREGWHGDDTHSGCRVSPDVIVCSSAFGIGTYEVVMTDDGEYVRDATFEDLLADENGTL